MEDPVPNALAVSSAALFSIRLPLFFQLQVPSLTVMVVGVS
jgi:hypothetical protein